MTPTDDLALKRDAIRVDPCAPTHGIGYRSTPCAGRTRCAKKSIATTAAGITGNCEELLDRLLLLTFASTGCTFLGYIHLIPRRHR